MVVNVFVCVCIDEILKNEVVVVFVDMGLIVFDLVWIILIKVVWEKVFLFDLCIFNEFIVNIIVNSDKGVDVYKVKDVDDFFDKLGIW